MGAKLCQGGAGDPLCYTLDEALILCFTLKGEWVLESTFFGKDIMRLCDGSEGNMVTTE